MIYVITDIVWEDAQPLYHEIEVELPDDLICHSDEDVVDAYLETMLECDTGYLPLDFTWEQVEVDPYSAAEWIAEEAARLRPNGPASEVSRG